MDTDGNIEVDIDTDSYYGFAIDDIKDEDEKDRDEAQSFINKEKVLKIFLAPSECFMTQFEHTFRLFLREFYYAHYCKMFSTLPSVYNQRADVCPLLIRQF